MMLLVSLAVVGALGLTEPRIARAERGSFLMVRPVAGDSLRGRVTDSTGKPIASANVTVIELARAASTDANGAFLLTDVPAGRYTVVARRVGYVATSRTIMLSAGDREPLDLRLPSIIGNLEPVVVTATRQAIDVKQSPLPVSELAGDRLHREQSVALANAIDGLPGVHSLTTGQQMGPMRSAAS